MQINNESQNPESLARFLATGLNFIKATFRAVWRRIFGTPAVLPADRPALTGWNMVANRLDPITNTRTQLTSTARMHSMQDSMFTISSSFIDIRQTPNTQADQAVFTTETPGETLNLTQANIASLFQPGRQLSSEEQAVALEYLRDMHFIAAATNGNRF